jgi:hypothetical protein
MEAAYCCETLVPTYSTTRCGNQNLSLNLRDSVVDLASLICLQTDDRSSVSVSQTVKSVYYLNIYQ